MELWTVCVGAMMTWQLWARVSRFAKAPHLRCCATDRGPASRIRRLCRFANFVVYSTSITARSFRNPRASKIRTVGGAQCNTTEISPSERSQK